MFEIIKLQVLLIVITNLLMYVSVVSMLPAKDLLDYQIGNKTLQINHSDNNDEPSSTDIADVLTSSATRKLQITNLPTTLKPQGFRAPSEESASTSQDALTPAAQNYFSTYFRPSIPPLGHSRPFYQPTEEPFISKFLTQQHHKQFVQQPRQQTFSHYDASILGSGDFGILRGGTFYAEEDQAYQQEENSDYYYSEASNAHSGPATEGFIQKYTYPEEQFAQFRDFADLNTPSETDYSQYVVVYAAKNSTRPVVKTKVPNNIFDQLQQIDEDKAAEERKLKKSGQGLSTRKMKLVKTKIVKKKWDRKSSKVAEDDPLLALS